MIADIIAVTDILVAIVCLMAFLAFCCLLFGPGDDNNEHGKEED